MSEPLPAKPRTRESAKSQTKAKTHLPRFKRATGDASSALPRLLLQERDCAILQDVARYRLLTTRPCAQATLTALCAFRLV